MGDKLTKKDIERIEAEIENRKLVVRKKAIEDVKEARSHGDLSENFEYYAAKKFKNENEGRIRYLERMLKNAIIIADTSADDEVGLDNTVTVYVEEDKIEETYKITTSIKGNSIRGVISNESPMGRAILGRKVGERVEVKVNDDYSYYVVIRKIENTKDEGKEELKKF